MIDSTDDKVIAMSLTYCQGKAIINSVNLEDGEERFEKSLAAREKSSVPRLWSARSTTILSKAWA